MNGVCKECHSAEDPIWLASGAHEGLAEDIRADRSACIDCHSEIHPTALHRRPKQAKADEVKP